MLDYFRNYSSNAHVVCCEDSPTKGPYGHCQCNDLDLHSRSQVPLKLDYFLICTDTIYAVTFKLCLKVDLWMPCKPMLVHGRNGSAKATKSMLNNIGNKAGLKTVGHILRDLDFANVYILNQLVCCCRVFFSFFRLFLGGGFMGGCNRFALGYILVNQDFCLLCSGAKTLVSTLEV